MTVETETETATPDQEARWEPTAAEAVPVAAEPEPPPPDPLAVATEGRIRAEARAQVLEEQLAAARAAPPVEARPAAKSYTAKDVRDAFDKGEITDDQRVAYLADLQVQARMAERDEQTRATQRETRFQTRYNAYLTQHPELRTKGPAADTVWAAAADLAEDEGLDPEDKRTQLRAMERVFGPLPRDAMPPMNGEVQRRRIPTGTGFGAPAAGGGGPGTGGAARDPLKGIPADYVAIWRRMGANLSEPTVAQRYADRFWAGRTGRQMGRPA
mgnify:CR=1 FL=1